MKRSCFPEMDEADAVSNRKGAYNISPDGKYLPAGCEFFRGRVNKNNMLPHGDKTSIASVDNAARMSMQ
jgi:hypothetical protein